MSRRPKGTGNIRERDGRYQARYSYVDGYGKRGLPLAYGSTSIWLKSAAVESPTPEASPWANT